MIYVGDVAKDMIALSPTLMEKCYLKHLPSLIFNELHQKIASVM